MNDKEVTISQTVSADDFIKYRFLKEYMKVGIGWKAYKAIKPEVSDVSARTLASKLLAKIDMVDVLEELGMGPNALGQEIVNGIKNANRPLETKSTKYRTTVEKNGKTLEAEITEREYAITPDYSTRQRYIDTATKVSRLTGPESISKTEVTNNIKSINVVNYGDKKDEVAPQSVVGQVIEDR